jgi:hypothetical protein
MKDTLKDSLQLESKISPFKYIAIQLSYILILVTKCNLSIHERLLKDPL